MIDLDLDAPVAMSRRDALKEAHRHLRAVIEFTFELALDSDEMDADHIREAARLVELALRETTAEQLARFGVAK